ncbi:MAG: carboxypeptidase M32 [Acidobacteria bacterium]|nr:carboxypeptidase M32 [Acidobacteriota bacterium]
MDSQEQSLIQSFMRQSRELIDLKSVLEILTWDQETMMPSRAGPFRARQLSALSALYHQKLTSPDLGEALERLSTEQLELWPQAAVREMRREHEKAVKLPEELVRELAETTSLAYEAWVKARQKSDFAAFSPWLEKVLKLKQEEARCLQFSDSLYEALLDHYEPGMTVGRLDELFAVIRPKLTSLLQQILSASKQPDRDLLKGKFPAAQQEAFGRDVLSAMGFQWDAGRLDRSPHPFCSGLSPLDVRITTRYSEKDFCSSLFGIIHEGGHALYEQGLDPEHYGSLACDGISMGIHESQSRLWENQIARSRAFWDHWFPRLRQTFPDQLDHVSLEDFVHAINRVEASLIRVEADEVSYGLHVILRYELEKQMIEGDLKVQDLEEAWNTRMKEYLEVTPSNSAEGVLQDVHWSQGAFGYFPTYLLGNLYGAQIFHQVGEELPDLEANIAEGNLIPLREWLGKQIHGKGKTVGAEELIEKISGKPLNSDYFLDYLKNKFTPLYGLSPDHA